MPNDHGSYPTCRYGGIPHASGPAAPTAFVEVRPMYGPVSPGPVRQRFTRVSVEAARQLWAGGWIVHDRQTVVYVAVHGLETSSPELRRRAARLLTLIDERI